MNNIDKKVAKILDDHRDIPFIFKRILKKETSLMPDEEIEDLILLEREYLQDKGDSPIFSPAKLLLLTSYGLIIVEEGFIKIDENFMGYRIQHINYHKITHIELDICLLAGRLKISTGAHEKPESDTQFNTTRYYRDFEHFIDALRKKMPRESRLGE